jgi:hypothetical protein
VSAPDLRHEVAKVRSEPGALSFEALVNGETTEVWMRTDPGEATSAEAILPTCLMPAMRFGGKLTVPEPVSPRVLRNQREFQAIQRAWSLEWEFGEPPLREVEVVAPEAEPMHPPEGGRVATFFSGGVDSWSIVLDEPAVTDLIFVRGFDLMLGMPQHAELSDRVEARLRDAAKETGLRLHVVETNLRSLSDPLLRWEVYYGCALDAIALFLAPRFERVVVTGDLDHETEFPMATSRMIDRLWSTEQVEIADAGGRYNRVERLRRISDHPVVQRTLRVCWENPDGAYNCGRCRKCLMTIITLEALGLRDAIETFPAELNLNAVADIKITYGTILVLWEDVLDTVRAAGRADLEPAVERVVERGKRELGLPSWYRRRATPGPPPLNRPAADQPPRPSDGGDASREARLEAELSTVLGSRSWKMTAPLRRAAARLRRISRGIR